ncbi:MAG: hybrid sensor histidine kinase/response regulator [Microcoleaceae cyanobacterium]
MNSDQADILIVDDTPENLKLLSSVLQEQQFRVRKSTNGQRAIQAMEVVPPDLILLDVMMPEMNGYQVAQYLKAQPEFCDIPIIFLSALTDTVDKVLAFEMGGVDYITKPFQVQEVLVRVRTQLMLQQQKRQLIRNNEQLQQEIQERCKVEAALRVCIHAISHDLRNPVTGMLMVLNTLLKKSSAEGEQIPVRTPILERMAQSCDRQLNLIDSLVETSDSEIQGIPLKCEPLDLTQFTQHFLAEWEPMLEKSQVNVQNLIPAQLPLVNADFYQLWRVFDNLFSNAIKYNPPGITLTLSVEETTKSQESAVQESEGVKPVLCYTIADNGVGIEPSELESLFDRYKRGDSVGKIQGLGLGLYLCRQIITAHGGEMGAIAQPHQGAAFWFKLPILET